VHAEATSTRKLPLRRISNARAYGNYRAVAAHAESTPLATTPELPLRNLKNKRLTGLPPPLGMREGGRREDHTGANAVPLSVGTRQLRRMNGMEITDVLISP